MKLLDDVEKNSKKCLLKMSELQIDSVRQRTNEINDRIDSFYDALENEVNAKRYVDVNHEQTAEKSLAYNNVDK